LHAVHPPERGDDNRWVHHGPLFRRRGKAYVDFERAIAWEKRNLRALIKAGAQRDRVRSRAPRPQRPSVPAPKRETKRSLLQVLFPF
jgi:hypothetical protein